MSGESLIMDEGRDENRDGGGGPPLVTRTGDVTGGNAATDAPPTTPVDAFPQRTSTISRIAKGHRNGRQHSRMAGKSHPLPRRSRQVSGSAANGSETENVEGSRTSPTVIKRSSGRTRYTVSPDLDPQQPGRRRIRSNKGKWKPYHTLTWEEKKQRDAEETLRAEEKRSQLTHLGYPQAPYNTTQFLMADCGTSDGVDMPSSDESSTAEDEWLSMDRGYDQAYERVYLEQLNALSKNELITRLSIAEEEKSKMERRIRTLEQEVIDLTQPKVDDDAIYPDMLVDAGH